MKYDYESTDLAGAAKLAADEAMPADPPDPSEYAADCPYCAPDELCALCLDLEEWGPPITHRIDCDLGEDCFGCADEQEPERRPPFLP